MKDLCGYRQSVESMAIRINSEQVKGSTPIHFRKGGHPHFKVRICLASDDASELDQVAFVKYELHPSFKDRYRSTSDRSSGFEIKIRTYGYFEISARLTKADGEESTVKGEVEF